MSRTCGECCDWLGCGAGCGNPMTASDMTFHVPEQGADTPACGFFFADKTTQNSQRNFLSTNQPDLSGRKISTTLAV